MHVALRKKTNKPKPLYFDIIIDLQEVEKIGEDPVDPYPSFPLMVRSFITVAH